MAFSPKRTRGASVLLSVAALATALVSACGDQNDPDSDDSGGAGAPQGGRHNNGDGDGDGGGDGDGDDADHHHEVTAGAPGTGGVDPGDVQTECGKAGTCGLIECVIEELPGDHVKLCAPLTPHSNPPTSGPHYPIWAQFGIYDEPITPGLLLHTLEHSAVALLYNCDLIEQEGGDCAELVGQLTEFYDDFEDDPLCTVVPHRLLIAPDPALDVPFAAAAWGYHLKGDCFDKKTVSDFIDAHYGQNYENICASGIDPSTSGCN